MYLEVLSGLAAVLKLLPLNRQNLRLVLFSNRCWACFFNDCYEVLLQQQQQNCLPYSCLASSVLVIRVQKRSKHDLPDSELEL